MPHKVLSWGFKGFSHFSEPQKLTVKQLTMWPGSLSQFFCSSQLIPFLTLCQKINNVLLLHFLAFFFLRVLRKLLFHIFKPSQLPQHLEMSFLCALLNPGLCLLHLWDLCLWVLENMTDTDIIASSDGPWLLTQHPLNG